jgi:hypothetical protein
MIGWPKEYKGYQEAKVKLKRIKSTYLPLLLAYLFSYSFVHRPLDFFSKLCRCLDVVANSVNPLAASETLDRTFECPTQVGRLRALPESQ